MVAILDNVGSHKKAARNAICPTGAHLLFPPPYSPDLNSSSMSPRSPSIMIFSMQGSFIRND
ncbi:hypothetical protein [Bradyrhizobium yuanmingense]|uniref:hypothetical protein n=1 Tax=Bradyrhizobium yuanmingense TaxID=108015 RepID=UPI003F81C9D9